MRPAATRLIRPPADQLGTTRSGHQWKPAWPRTRSRSVVRRTHWRATASSSPARGGEGRVARGWAPDPIAIGGEADARASDGFVELSEGVEVPVDDRLVEVDPQRLGGL